MLCEICERGHHNPARVTTSHHEILMKVSASKGFHTLILGANPIFLVAVNKGDIPEMLNGAFATFDQAAVEILAIGNAGCAVCFLEGDGEETALGLGDQIFEVCFHIIVGTG